MEEYGQRERRNMVRERGGIWSEREEVRERGGIWSEREEEYGQRETILNTEFY